MSISDLTELISPAFTEKTVLDILNKRVHFKEVEDIKISIDNEASKKGDSYLSTICRFVLIASGTISGEKIETVSVPVIVKFFPKNVPRQKTFRSADFFKTEIYFYEKVWPQIKKIKSAKLPNDPDEIPLLLAAHCDGKNDFIALEDLGYQGYKPLSRNDDINRGTLTLCLRALANFHALGIVTQLENFPFESIASDLPESYLSERLRSWYENFLHESMGPHYEKAVKALLPEKYQEKITKLFSRDLIGDAIKCYTVRDKLCTFTQGDAWLPNFLVKNNNDGGSTAILIDFQLARFGPVTNDLLQFLYACVPNQMLLENWDDLIKEYHQHLSERIEQLGGPQNYVSLKEINDEIHKYPYLGIIMAMESTLMSLLADNEVADLDTLEGENAFPLEDVWILPEFDQSRNERLIFLVKHLADKGLIF